MFGFALVPVVCAIIIVSLLSFFDDAFYNTYIQPAINSITHDSDIDNDSTTNNKKKKYKSISSTQSTASSNSKRHSMRSTSSHSSNSSTYSSRSTSPNTLRQRALRRMHRQAKIEAKRSMINDNIDNNSDNNNTTINDVWSTFTPNRPPISYSKQHNKSNKTDKTIIRAGIQPSTLLTDQQKNDYIRRTKRNNHIQHTHNNTSEDWRLHAASIYNTGHSSVFTTSSISVSPTTSLPTASYIINNNNSHTRQTSTPLFVVQQPLRYTASTTTSLQQSLPTSIIEQPTLTQSMPPLPVSSLHNSVASVSPHPYYLHNTTQPSPLPYNNNMTQLPYISHNSTSKQLFDTATVDSTDAARIG